MKVPINQTNVSRVGINTARIQGIVLDQLQRGGGTSPFHPSLVDYWSFKGKSNFDKDRNTIKGIKGEILTAYNFGWSLGSGYGLFKENYLTYNKAQNVFVTDDHSITIMNFVPANTWLFFKYGTDLIKATKVRVTGLTATDQLTYEYYPSDGGSRAVFPIPGDGEYDLPESIPKSSGDPLYNVGFAVRGALTKNVTIEQIPQYEGAIVTDGVDDYLKLDKVGYKIGTVILKYIPLFRDNNWRYVFDVTEERCYFASNKNSGFFVTSMQYKSVGDYTYLIPRTGNSPTVSNTPLHISTNTSVKEFLSMALYEMAIYQDVLTDEEIQKEINVMEYGTPNPVFALNFDNFAYKVTDYPEMFGTGKATTNKIVVDSTTESFTGVIAVAMNPEVTTGDAIEVPAYKLKISGFNDYNLPESSFGVAILASNISGGSEYIAETPALDGVYDVPSIALSDGIFNLAIVTQIAIDKPIEIEILYDKNITKSFPETKQIFP